MRKTILGSNSTPTSPTANTLLAALPSDLRAVMKGITKYTDNVANDSGHVSGNVTATTDYLPLLAEFELRGAIGNCNTSEGNSQAQYDYYKAGNSKVKCMHTNTSANGAITWWLRSPYYGNSTHFAYVTGESGAVTSRSASGSSGVAPCFAV